MKEHPILFKPEMVRALLNTRPDGSAIDSSLPTKTQTRRVVKPQPSGVNHRLGRIVEGGPSRLRDKHCLFFTIASGDFEMTDGTPCPYGQPSDRLYVREQWAPDGDGFIYRADVAPDDSGERDGWWLGERFVGPVRWKPSIHMPKDARRLWLDVKALRVERVQDISDADSRAEGIPPECRIRPRAWFGMTWDGINARRGHPWANNDWVWVYTFERAEAAS
ncbi:MAG: hypothetical protein NCW75_05695 [Phycisphaera sp.]|nr:MAG: hypothetical protein NCW75_05695 [Phycisphaera sp.]